jgi:hypothetical protein
MLTTATASPVGGTAAGYGAPVEPTPRHTPAPTRARAAVAVAGAVLAALLAACSPTADPDPDPAPPSDAATSSAPTPEPVPSEAVPTPDAHTAVGELADGFPADLLPVPPEAEILVSTWAPQGEPGAGQPYDVSLNVRSDLPVADVAALYRASLTGAGFAETVGTPTAGLAAESTYSRSSGAELVTVGVLDRDGVRTVTVGGTVRASG